MPLILNPSSEKLGTTKIFFHAQARDVVAEGDGFRFDAFYNSGSPNQLETVGVIDNNVTIFEQVPAFNHFGRNSYRTIKIKLPVLPKTIHPNLTYSFGRNIPFATCNA